MSKVAKQLLYEGKVQGVGFRYSVKLIAAGFEVVGWVRNSPDGRVELQVMGEAVEVEGFLKEIAESHLASHVARTEMNEIAPLAGAKTFQIIQ